jgi:hypothetical protein
MDSNKMREQFEAYWKRQLWAECYADVKEQMFTVWKASREAVVVELPERDVEPCNYSLGFNSCLKESRQAIEAQGLKVGVKP